MSFKTILILGALVAFNVDGGAGVTQMTNIRIVFNGIGGTATIYLGQVAGSSRSAT